MELKDTFNNVVSDYEYARPVYPDKLYTDINSFSEISSENSALLEVGAGTGQATDYYARMGFKITAIEVGDAQVKRLTEKYKNYKNTKVVRSYFEDYQSNTSYDMIFSATAFHWIDESIGYKKAYDLLKENGTMAVFWQMASVTYLNTSIHNGLNALKKTYMPNELIGYDEEGLLKIKELRIRQMQTGGWFNNPEYLEYKWTDIYDADRYVALLNTYSSVQMLDEITRKKYLVEVYKYINENGGTVEMPQCVCLYMVKKKT